jgi:hypothetical protein
MSDAMIAAVAGHHISRNVSAPPPTRRVPARMRGIQSDAERTRTKRT